MLISIICHKPITLNQKQQCGLINMVLAVQDKPDGP